MSATARSRKPSQQQRPAAAEPPTRHRQAADHDRDERQVAERVRKVGGDRELMNRRSRRRSRRTQLRPGGADRESANRRVEQRDRLGAAGDAGADEQHDPGEGGEVEAIQPPSAADGNGIGSRPRARSRSRSRRTPNTPARPRSAASRPRAGPRSAREGRSRRPPGSARAGTSSGRGNRRGASIGRPTVNCAEKRHARTISANSAKRATSLPTRTTMPMCSASRAGS